MPPKRKASFTAVEGTPVAAPPVKTPRVPEPPPRVRNYNSLIVGTVSSVDNYVVVGYLYEWVCFKMEENDFGHQSILNRRIITNPPLKFIQFYTETTPRSRSWFPLPRYFGEISPRYLDDVGTAKPTYLEATRGILVIPGLEDRFRAHVMKRYNNNPNSDGSTLATHLISGLKETAAIREKDNLHHLYALFSQAVRTTAELERIFLSLITGSSNNNKHGVVITSEHVETYCYLLEAEGRFGLPTPELTWIKGTEKYDRHSKLDLSHACADLFIARFRQLRGLQFVRPLCTSLITNIADGYQNGIKPALCTYYGIKNATSRAYMGL
jgi:hypothetical protein